MGVCSGKASQGPAWLQRLLQLPWAGLVVYSKPALWGTGPHSSLTTPLRPHVPLGTCHRLKLYFALSLNTNTDADRVGSRSSVSHLL